MILEDMPKMEAPFKRANGVVLNEVNPGYEWVFGSPHVICSEKLDGTNVSIGIIDGRLCAIRNRLNVIPCGNLDANRYIEGVRVAYFKGRMPINDGQHFGELMGSGIQRNSLGLDHFEWFPFEYIRRKWSYTSFHKYDRTFENWSSWLQNDIFSLATKALNPTAQIVQPEGVVFYNTVTGQMAKLRRDMFDWYKGDRHGD